MSKTKNYTILWQYLAFFLVLVILLLFSFAKDAKALTIYENFDTYTAGESINGQGGWTTTGTGNLAVVNTNSNTNPNSLTSSTNNSISAYRNLSASSTNFFLEAYIRPDAGTREIATGIGDASGSDFSFWIESSTGEAVANWPGSGSYTFETGLALDTYHRIAMEATHNGTSYEVNLYVNGSLDYSTTTSAYSAGQLSRHFIFRPNAGTGGLTGHRIDTITLLTDADINPESGIIDIVLPNDMTAYPFNPIPVEITYNNIDTYDYLQFDLVNTDYGQNVYVQNAYVPFNGTSLTYETNWSLGLTGNYTLRVRLFDSVEGTYTEYSDTIVFILGSESTIPDQGFSSSTFATSTALDSGNLLSYVNVPQLLLTKAPFGYFFQIYGIVTNAVNNPPEASNFGVGDFDINLNGATTIIVMFSTSTVAHFLTPSIISPIRALLVAITYIITAISIYHIVRQSHVL